MIARSSTSPLEDREAVLEVIERETKAYSAKDFDGWAACWVHSDRTVEAATGNLGTFIRRGWDDLSSAMQKIMHDDPEPLPLPFRHVDFHVSIDNDTAWVTFLSTCQVTGDERFDMPDSFEIRVLERHNGEWLIAYIGVMALRSGPIDRSRILVGQEGQVIWASEASLDMLRTHPHLTISAGRLRAMRTVWDKILQDAFRRASELHHFSQLEETPLAKPSRFRFPVVLGEDDEGGVLSCLVYVRDGGTYVSITDKDAVKEHLEVSKVIFGLSDAQARLAERIVSGMGLTASAQELAISINTARTHLSRIYDKTGVNSQSALVRTLLSVGAAGY